ncbi:type VI secretion system protein ImpM [Luteimonas cucumeris]|uniref:Type VI secretion system protein ImpM n=1 Tax=Luteimonas cucumeris TaxID=985012 RepID=A0A562LAV8_9GAMM|nr:type VI secretion system-associated protein TagF [Luteimonas cucumeris]TWI04761.1 type VI secretion system protein ImpM [Luteimonas cucumeris]
MDAAGPGLPISYFGKLPSQGDFVRTSDNHPLMSLLDRWAGQGVELLAQDPAWKQTYDTAAPLHFAFLGSLSRLAVAGHFLPSRDASERRFPFLSATCFEVAQPLGFIARAPMALTRLWASLSRQGKLAIAAGDASEPLRELAENRIPVNADHAAYDASFADFLDTQAIGDLQTLLHESGHTEVVLKTLLPALGLLLQPVLAGGASQIDKALALPLPRDALYRPLVAAFWLDLVSGFVGRADFELAILVKDGATPLLLVGFNGADGRILQAGLDPQFASEQLIRVADAEWVEDLLASDYALNKLASYLQHDGLSLRVARKAFNETFLGV